MIGMKKELMWLTISHVYLHCLTKKCEEFHKLSVYQRHNKDERVGEAMGYLDV